MYVLHYEFSPCYNLLFLELCVYDKVVIIQGVLSFILPSHLEGKLACTFFLSSV